MAGSREENYRTIGKLVAALVAAGVLIAGLALPYVGGLGLVAGREADKFQNTTCDLKESKPPQRTTLYAKDGKTVIASLFNQNRVEIGLKDIPQTLQQALIATEDRRFYQHHGVDMRGLVRSAVNTTNGDTQGGSTLTMQYVKQVRYYEAGDDQKKQQAAVAQNLNRKIEDAKCAIYIESTLKESKQQILQNYLNIAFFGENSYGIQTAAKTYFNKNAAQLQPQESALLVGLLRAPSAYDPFVNRVAAKERRDEVLQNMVATKNVSQAQADAYKAMPISLASNGPPQVRQGCANSVTTVSNAGFFCDYVRIWLESVTKLTDQQLQTGGYKIVTTLDPKIQNSAQTNIAKDVPTSSPYTAVLPVVEPKTGNILAMASSRQYGVKSGQTVQPIFSRPTAQGASTFKLFPLLAALSQGMPANWPLKTVGGNDEHYKTGSCTTKINAVNGDPHVSYNATETLTSAMVKSSNTFFVGMTDQFFGCRLDSMVALAQQLGISNLSEKISTTATVASDLVNNQRAQQFTLGVPSASPLAMAGAYAAVANQGKFNAPAPVTMVYDSDGNPIDTKRPAGVQVVAQQTAAQAVDIMKGETKGAGTSAARFTNYYSDNTGIVAGKTGTAQAYPASKNGAIWFVGMTPDLVAATTIADFDSPSTPQRGLPGVAAGDAYGDYAAKVWINALKPTLKGTSWTWPKPDDVDGTDVPNVKGESEEAAKADLTSAGFKVHVVGEENQGSPTLCPSTTKLEDIGFYGPSRAPAGSTINICQSSGQLQELQAPTRSSGSGSNRGSGSSRGSGSNRGSGSSRGSGRNRNSGGSNRNGGGSGRSSGSSGGN